MALLGSFGLGRFHHYFGSVWWCRAARRARDEFTFKRRCETSDIFLYFSHNHEQRCYTIIHVLDSHANGSNIMETSVCGGAWG